MLSWPALLLLGATQRDCGKTHFACSLIERLSRSRPVLGLKVTVIRDEDSACPRGGAGCGVCGQLQLPYELCREHLTGTDKDTRRMLAAGASAVWWLRVRQDAVEEGIKALWTEVDPAWPVVCESNSLRRTLTPGLFLMIRDDRRAAEKATARAVMPLADLIVRTDGKRHRPGPEDLDFMAGRWTWVTPDADTPTETSKAETPV